MKRFLLSLILLSPFLVCDPQLGVEYYMINGLPGITQVQAQPDGSIRADLASIPVGSYSIQVKACKEVWCSDPAPFDFVRPEVGKAIHIRLSQ